MAAATGKKTKPTNARIRISPFRLVVTVTKDGFVMDFVGTDENGRRIEVEMQFPRWWVGEIVEKLAQSKRG